MSDRIPADAALLGMSFQLQITDAHRRVTPGAKVRARARNCNELKESTLLLELQVEELLQRLCKK